AAFFLPLPGAPLKLFPPELSIVDPLYRKLPHHYALRRDSCMIHSRQVQGVVSPHAMPPRQDIDFSVVEHMPDVQRTGYVWWRNHDRKHRPRRARVGPEQGLLHPEFSPTRLNLLRFVGFCDFASHPVQFSKKSGAALSCAVFGFGVIFDYTG